jgi:4-hydroxyphenylacetate 3-monooxygenase
MATTVYDYPLSSRLDEIDSLIVLHDVFVPWEQVFVYRDVELTNAQFHETGAHVLANFQSLVRFGVKMRFLTAAARRVCELHGIAAIPPVQAIVGGEVALASGVIDALVLAAVNQPVIQDGVARPSPRFVYDGMAYQRQVVTEVMRAIRELCGGGVIAVPSSSAAFTSPETGEDVARYYRSASATAEERVKVLKLVWDLIGTEFAGRQLQYEMFYSAAKQIVDQRVYRHHPWEEAEQLLETCLRGYGLAS